MTRNYWLIILFVIGTMVCNGGCRPRESSISAAVHPGHGSAKESGNLDQIQISTVAAAVTQRENAESNTAGTAQEQKFDIESIATVARVSSDGSSAPSSAFLGNLPETVGQMVESDVRTPPKLKEILKEKASDKREPSIEEFKPMPVTFVYDEEKGKSDKVSSFYGTEKLYLVDTSEGKASNENMKVIINNDGVKGIAIPVLMDDVELETIQPPKRLQKIPEVAKPTKEEKKKSGMTKFQTTTTPSSGLSTWILLSDNREVTTLSPKKSHKKDGNEEKKRTTGRIPTTKKPTIKVQATTTKGPIAVRKVTSKPLNTGTKKAENSTSALEALVKSQKKGSTGTGTGTTTTPNPKASAQKIDQSDSKKKLSEKMDVAEAKENVEVELPGSKVVNSLPAHFIMTTVDPTALNATEQNNVSTVTDNPVEGTTKKKKSSAKKKKKTKKKKKPETGVEAKVPAQKVGNQIYNFLSREIVPTVGLGLIGVALTAGLASFLGYNPFLTTTVPLRRTYETNYGYSPSNYYNYNGDYGGGGQSEEVLLGQVLSGMPEENRFGLTNAESRYSETYGGKDQSYDTIKTSSYSSPTGSIYSSNEGTEKIRASNQKSGSVYSSSKESASYDPSYSQDYSSYAATYDVTDKTYPSEVEEKYPVYTRETGTSFVYPETPAMTSAEKITGDQSSKFSQNHKYVKASSETMERQPEALYRVASDGDVPYEAGESVLQGTNWHRMGTPVESTGQYARLEPGPRSLDLSKTSDRPEERKRTKRDVESNIQRIARKRAKVENDSENEIDFDGSANDRNGKEPVVKQGPIIDQGPNVDQFPTLPTIPQNGQTDSSTKIDSSENGEKGEGITTTEGKKDSVDESSEAYPVYDETEISTTNSVMVALKRLAQFKLRLGLNFLRSTTEMFSRYLETIQKKVDETFTNTTTVQYNRKDSPWSRIFFANKNDHWVRKRRSALEDNPILMTLQTQAAEKEDGEEEEERKGNSRRTKSTKKDLKMSEKIFHHKKIYPKKYESKTGN